MKIRIHFRSLLLSISILSLCFGQTNVSGIISSNTSWTLSNSPYIATGNILLNENTTLTIEPGVIVKFESDLVMQIKGTLIAQGTADNKITFTSNSSSPSMNDWTHIKFFDESTDAVFSGGNYISGSVMEYCIVEYANNLYISKSRPYIVDSEFRYNEIGIQVYNDDYNQPDLLITNNLFHSNHLGFKSYSVASIGQGGLDFNSNQVYNNTLEGGIEASYGGTYSNNLIKNNIYSDDYGYDAAGGFYGRPYEVINNIIIGNSYLSFSGDKVDGVSIESLNDFKQNFLHNDSGNIDLYVHNDWGGGGLMNNIIGGLTELDVELKAPISNNIFAGGLNGTILFELNNGNEIANFKYNHVLNSSGGQLAIFSDDNYNSGLSPIEFSNNLFYGNNSGYFLYHSNSNDGQLYIASNYNNIIGNPDFNIKASTESSAAENHFWGTVIESEIQNLIYDWNDDANLGFIDYDPWLSSPDTDAPISPPNNVIAQSSGNDVVLTWDANPEPDLVGYKIYYGNYTGYSYSNSIDIGDVNTYTLPGVSIDSSISVTAYDGNIDGSNDQVEGYESWFSLALFVNNPPIVENMTFATDEDNNVEGTLLGNDVDGQALQYEVVSNPLNGNVSINTSDGIFTYAPNSNYNGTDSFTFTANDGTATSDLATVTITISPVNDIPTVTNMNLTIDEDESYLGTLSGSDVDGDNLTYSIISAPENGSIELTDISNYTYTPSVNYNGTDLFTYLANDGTVDSELATVTITINAVNDPPTFLNVPDITINEDDLVIMFDIGPYVQNDDDGYLTYVHSSDNSAFTYEPDGSFVYFSIEPNWNGISTFTSIVTDQYGLSDTVSYQVIVLPINDAPEFPEMPNLVVDEDNILAIQLSATDIDGDYLTYFVDPVENIDLYIYNNQNLDSLLMVPQPDWSGTVNINLTVDDGNGLSDQTSFTLTVNPIDDDPFVDGYLEDVYFYEDFQEPWIVNLDEIFTDIDGELTYTAFPTDPTVIGIEVSENMLHLFSLANANGTTDLIVTASNPMRSSVSDTLLVTVFSENDPPVINALDPISFDEDQTYELPTIASLVDNGTIVDIDTDVAELGFDIFSENEQIHIDWNGYTSSTPQIIPDENYNGSGTITLCVYDAEFSECIDIAVTVNPVNDAPFFTSEMHATVGVGQEFHLNIGVTDIDEQDLTLTITAGETNPTWVILSDLTMHGTPDELGTFPVYLTLSDGEVDLLDTFHIHVENFMPTITSITDVPNDQGGRVYLSFNASFFDDGQATGQSYSFYRYDVLAPDSSGWVLLGSGDAVGDPSYTYEAVTLGDSLSDTQLEMAEFKVVASMIGGIFHSEPMMGYSVDNIAPGVPGDLMAVAMDDNIQLTWDMNTEEDFQYYILEKSLNTDFVDLEVIELVDTSYTDMNFAANQTNYYRVTAVDYAGNHSETSPIVEATIMLSIDVHLMPVEFALHQNYPNPFNPTTQIRYDLPEDQIVNIVIYDVIGRKIRSLLNTSQTAGYHSIRWDAKNDIGEGVAAGMYIYTIQAGEFRATKKMVLLK